MRRSGAGRALARGGRGGAAGVAVGGATGIAGFGSAAGSRVATTAGGATGGATIADCWLRLSSTIVTMAARAVAPASIGQRAGRRCGSLIRANTRWRMPGRGSTASMSRTARSMAASTLSRSLFMAVSRCGHLFLQQPPRLGDAPFDRAHRDPEDVADLRVTVVPGAGKQQGVAQLARQRPDQPLDG